MDEYIINDLESLRGILIQGDITPVVYDLLKNTIDPDGLLRFLGSTIREEKEPEEESCYVPKYSFTDLFNSGIEIRSK